MKWIKNIEIARVKGETMRKEEDILIVEYPFTIFINQEIGRASCRERV